MGELGFRLIREGAGPKGGAPLNIAFLDLADIRAAGMEIEGAFRVIAAYLRGPVGINIFDLEAVTTTSDGIAVDGAIVAMAAGDIGRVNPEFGLLFMEEMPVTAELIQEEPHLRQLAKNFPGRKLYRGPDPHKKLIPVHNAAMTGKAVNNNSATEMMNAVTMREILLPILGQLQIMKDGPIVHGYAGEAISVGIGMTVAEKFGRVFPTRQFRAGDTAHGSGEYAKTLKKNIPCLVAPKSVLAGYIVRALRAGMVPGSEIGCSPAVLAVAAALGAPIAYDRITAKAWAELASIGITRESLARGTGTLSAEKVIEAAEAVIPGVDEPVLMESAEIVEQVRIAI